MQLRSKERCSIAVDGHVSIASTSTVGRLLARWLKADPATHDADHLVPSEEWIVVAVFVNGSEDDHAAGLRALVPGVEASQSLAKRGVKVERHG
jgi:hypothetical protein